MAIDHNASVVESPQVTKSDPEITRTDIDGVPVFSAQSDGPLTAALAFRGGLIDETLATHGITHLIEHLALSTIGQQSYQYNGMVEGLLTVFTVTGSGSEVVDFFARVAAALRGLPLERLEHESRVLHTEQASRTAGALDSLLSLRFGATGWGLAAYQEYGLHCDTTRVEEWRAEIFTRQNAAFWISGNPPDGLRLDLPVGSRRVVPPLAQTSFPLPAWTAMRSAGIGMSMLGERSTHLTAALHIAERRARARLRYDQGISYDVPVTYLRLDATTAHVTMGADALPDNAVKVRDGLLSVVEELITTGPSPDEIRTEVEMAEKSLDSPGRLAGRLHGEVGHELYGAPRVDRDEILRELRESAPGDIARALGQAIATALVVVPEGLSVAGRYQPVPEWSTDRFKGRTLRLQRRAGYRPTRLTLSPQGVMLTLDKKRIVTVAYRRCAAVLTWNDGSRTLMGEDGARMHLRPADWRKGEKAIQEIDSHLPKERFVALGDRPIPDPAALVKPLSRLNVAALRVVWGLNLLIAILTGGLALAAIARIAGGNGGQGDQPLAIVFGLFSIALAGYLTYQVRSGRLKNQGK